MRADSTLPSADLLKLVARFDLDVVGPSAVVEWAVSQLARGAGDETLLRLAIATSTRAAVEPLVRQLLDSLRLPYPGPGDRGILAAAVAAQSIIDGAVSPFEGADFIDSISISDPSSRFSLRVFVGLASQCDDPRVDRTQLEDDIRAEAVALIEEAEERVTRLVPPF